MNPEKWYFKNSTIMVAFLTVGALALPLVWFNPRYSVKSKILITIVSIVITYFVTMWTAKALSNLIAQYQKLTLGSP